MPSEMEVLAKISNSGLSQGEKEDLRRRMIKEGMTDEFLQAVEDACGTIHSTRYTARPVEKVPAPPSGTTPEFSHETARGPDSETISGQLIQPAPEIVPETVPEVVSEAVPDFVPAAVPEPTPEFVTEPVSGSVPEVVHDEFPGNALIADSEKTKPDESAAPAASAQKTGSPFLVLFLLVGSALLLGYTLWVHGILTF